MGGGEAELGRERVGIMQVIMQVFPLVKERKCSFKIYFIHRILGDAAGAELLWGGVWRAYRTGVSLRKIIFS